MVETPSAVNQIPTTGNAPQEEVERARVIKASILENQTSEVTMCGNDIVSLFLLTKLVSIILADLLGSLPNKGGRNETSVHS